MANGEISGPAQLPLENFPPVLRQGGADDPWWLENNSAHTYWINRQRDVKASEVPALGGTGEIVYERIVLPDGMTYVRDPSQDHEIDPRDLYAEVKTYLRHGHLVDRDGTAQAKVLLRNPKPVEILDRVQNILDSRKYKQAKKCGDFIICLSVVPPNWKYGGLKTYDTWPQVLL